MKDLQVREFTTSGLSYILEADQKTIDTTVLKKLNLFNRKKIVANSVYYTDGVFNKKNIKVTFKRGYFLEGVFYMKDCYSSNGKDYIKSKTAKYMGSFIEFSGVMMKKNNKQYRKYKYIVKTQQ